jgi:lipoprotein-releasing system permease protein
MFKPFFLFVSLRYSLTKKHNFILSFVSFISMLGVSLGVLILIVALSVINGSITTMRGEALKSVPHVTISGPEMANNWRAEIAQAEADPEVIAAAPFIEGEAAMRFQGINNFIRLRGVDPGLEATVVENSSERYQELLSLLGETENGIVLGAQLAGSLGIYSGEEVSAISLGSLLQRSLSDTLGFRVIGFADFGIYSNNNIALIKLNQAQDLFANDNGIDVQLRLKVADVFRAEEIATETFADSSEDEIVSWNEAQANLFNALNMEKILTSFMLLMIVVIGAVNIISTLVMVVSDKTSDIAILRTMGASRSSVMKIFVLQGMVAGIFGTAVGAFLGILLANYVTELSLMLERLINFIFTEGNVYFISHLRTQVNFGEVLMVCIAALLISFLATLYPAYRASKIQPADVLRYE